MANEIRTKLQVEWYRGSILSRFTPLTQYSVSTTSEVRNETVQSVGTSHELIAAADASDDSFCVIENLHATAKVQIGLEVAAAFTAVIDIPAGGPPAILPIVSSLAATYLQSDTAATPVRITLIKLAS